MMTILSNPSKMPGKAFGLPAGRSCPWAVYQESSDGRPAICSGCYAQDGFYRMPNVKATQDARFQWVREGLKSGEFVATMIETIRGQKYFRIHDSGDFFNVAYVDAWRAIAQALPDTMFWAPTRSYQDARMLAALRKLAKLPNVVIRPSALHFGDNAPKIAGLQAGSTADGPASFDCPASLQGGKCLDCRVCWTKPGTTVNYHVHGSKATKLVRISKA